VSGVKGIALKKTDVALELVETGGTRLSRAGRADLKRIDRHLRKALEPLA